MFEPMLERLGFKKTVYILAVIQIIAVVCTYSFFLSLSPLLQYASNKTYLTCPVEISAQSWIQFSVGRVLAYLAVGIVEPLVPTYQAELAPAPLRGFFAGNVQVLVHVGSIWGSGMSRAYANEQGKKGWIVPTAMQFIPAILLLIAVPFCIESPRWLINHGRRVSFCLIEKEAVTDYGRTKLFTT